MNIRGIEFGRGIPKVCVPLVAEDMESILLQAEAVMEKQPDCVEFRADWFMHVMDKEKLLDLLRRLREILGDTVLLFTFRTDREGGQAGISSVDYIHLCEQVCQSGYVDLLDVEAYMGEGLLSSISEMAHQYHVYVVGSNHDFFKTPSEEEMVKRLQFMDKEGADIPKLAVMPENMRDVITLLSATWRYREMGGKKPVITISMGGDGTISRLIGEAVGSAVTFASAGQSSAAGQVPVDEVCQVLKVIHEHR